MLKEVKLNNKGYLLVEIIVSFVMAMGVAYFLAEITLDLKDKQQDLDKEIQYNFDKSLIIKEVMDDFKSDATNFYDVSLGNDDEGFIFSFGRYGERRKKLLFDKETNEFLYGEIDDEENFIYDDLYIKKLDESLIVDSDNIEYNILTLSPQSYYVKLTLPVTSPYSDKDYNINIIVPCSMHKNYRPIRR